MIQRKYIALLSSLLIAAVSGTATADALVNFTLSLNTAKDPGQTYNNFHEAGAGIKDTFAIGFQIAINGVNGTNVNSSPVAAFCSELQESISVSTYTFKAQNLSTLAAGQAGKAGTASSAIPVGGIGHQRAAYVNYLFDCYYTSEALSGWTITTAQPTTQAFQLALWELTHDSDLSITKTTGQVYIGAQTAGTTTQITQRNNAIALAQSMIDTVRNANISSTYMSTNFSIWALVNEGSPGYQDVVLATKKTAAIDKVLEPLLPTPALPEPTTQALITLTAGIFWMVSRFQRRR
jgi:hypothetical protein